LVPVAEGVEIDRVLSGPEGRALRVGGRFGGQPIAHRQPPTAAGRLDPDDSILAPQAKAAIAPIPMPARRQPFPWSCVGSSGRIALSIAVTPKTSSSAIGISDPT
jgi:hypothetical protein